LIGHELVTVSNKRQTIERVFMYTLDTNDIAAISGGEGGQEDWGPDGGPLPNLDAEPPTPTPKPAPVAGLSVPLPVPERSVGGQVNSHYPLP
jgi:hypothetical protein